MPTPSSVDTRPEVRRPGSSRPDDALTSKGRQLITLEGRFPSEPLVIDDPEEWPTPLVGAYLIG